MNNTNKPKNKYERNTGINVGFISPVQLPAYYNEHFTRYRIVRTPNFIDVIGGSHAVGQPPPIIKKFLLYVGETNIKAAIEHATELADKLNNEHE